MEDKFKECLWKNFAASIDMLGNIIKICPDTMWSKQSKFYYMAYHTVIFLDYYLSYPVKDFQPELPYTLVPAKEIPSEAIDDVLPDRLYSKREVTDCITSARGKCEALIGPGTSQDLLVRWIEKPEIDLHGLCPAVVEEYSLLEILFYNFRHVQHHAAQLNYMLRSHADVAAEWISQAD